MKSTPLRWTSGLLLASGVLVGVAVWTRGGDEAPIRPRPRAEVRREPPPPAPKEIEIARVPDPPRQEAAAPGPLPPAAWADGYREAGEEGGEGLLMGQVFTSEGPLIGGLVNVEWVMAFRPTPDQARKLRRGGARRDRDGVWWGKARAVTDESGFFSVEGLPPVQLKVSAAGKALSARPGQTVLLRAGNP